MNLEDPYMIQIEYLVIGAIFYTIFIVIFFSILFLAYAAATLAPTPLRKLLLRYAPDVLWFFAVLLVVGNFFNGLWTLTIYGIVYKSVDYVGMDCLPFLPLTQRTIDDFGLHGQLFGITLPQLQCIWLAFAVCTWVFTVWIYGMLRRFRVRPIIPAEA